MDPFTDTGTAPDDASSLPARGGLHTNTEAFRGHFAEVFAKTSQHRGAGQLELGRPGRMVD